jgi:NAD(P)-dependent dehydrogenase (short-subunit alcohol dehydrogenase family)
MLMKDKVCVVTGAASAHGIGRATAKLLAENGANVVVMDISERISSAAEALSGEHPSNRFRAIRSDISAKSECEAARDIVLKEFGHVDALIHSAGIMRPAKFEAISEADFSEMIAINLTGTFNIIQAFAGSMIERRAGSIVSVASVAAQRGGGLFGGAHYAASKGGVLSLVRTLARECGSAGVRVNAVCPSLIETDFVADAMSAERLQELSTTIPLGRPGRPEEVAGACMFLASDLSGYMTGTTLDVNGGIHIH